MKRALACLAVLLCACAPVATTASATPPSDQTFTRDHQPSAQAQATCSVAHGAYHQVGLMATWVCVTPTADAGKVCSGKKDCTGQCIYEGEHPPSSGQAVHGRCQRTNVQFGCYSMVEGSHAQPPLCVD